MPGQCSLIERFSAYLLHALVVSQLHSWIAI
jgi:hypothetical protein